MLRLLWLLFIAFFLVSCEKEDEEVPDPLIIVGYSIGGISGQPAGISLNPLISLTFNKNLKTVENLDVFNLVSRNSQNHELIWRDSGSDSTLQLKVAPPLQPFTKYTLIIDESLEAEDGTHMASEFKVDFTTELDSTDKFPRISDTELLDIIQAQTFKYFWDFGHPSSGMIRERNSSGDITTTGGTGFGIMAILVGIERNFIGKEEGMERITQIVDFLDKKATKYHGAFAHWIDGRTGETISFSKKDNGGDLVETSFLMAGLLCAAEYFSGISESEIQLRETIDTLWRAVEWDWYSRGEKVLYWHWSPEYGWDMNLPIIGWNEALVTYILAAASPTHPIDADVYHLGWASGGKIVNNKSYYDFQLPLGPRLGGPLFFEHYSFLGIDPRNLIDRYADYQEQTINHSLINHAYCVDNPRNYYGYSDECWGLTAGDSRKGYVAHSPTVDRGVITPTAALGSMPFTPEESLKAARFFYYKLGNILYGKYGFKDGISPHYAWVADSYLAINQGPILISIENYRSGLIWNYTMKNKDIKQGLTKLGFNY